jgi:hypothetical protein
MQTFRKPDWQGPFSTGMWQICYRLDGDRHILFFGGEGPRAPSRPECEWGLAVMCGKERDFDAEQRVRSIPELKDRCRPCDLGGTEVLALLEKDIDFVVDRVREAFHDAPLSAQG